MLNSVLFAIKTKKGIKHIGVLYGHIMLVTQWKEFIWTYLVQ